jgi:hypothetical protein
VNDFIHMPRHGSPVPLADDELAIFNHDPDLAMVSVDMHTWMLMNPCFCTDDDGICYCNEDEEKEAQ